jgi:hypothetical protein
MITVFDEQTGKLLSGFPTEINEHTFTLVDEKGNALGKFPVDNLKAPQSNTKP